MFKYLLSLILVLIVTISYSQNSSTNIYRQDLLQIRLTDSIKIPYKYLVASNQALTELKSYKGNIEGFLNERTRNKDIVIASQQKEIKFLKERDDKKDALIQAYQKDSVIVERQLQDFKKAARQERAKKWGIGVTVPIAAVLGFLLGWYLPH